MVIMRIGPSKNICVFWFWSGLQWTPVETVSLQKVLDIDPLVRILLPWPPFSLRVSNMPVVPNSTRIYWCLETEKRNLWRFIQWEIMRSLKLIFYQLICLTQKQDPTRFSMLTSVKESVYQRYNNEYLVFLVYKSMLYDFMLLHS